MTAQVEKVIKWGVNNPGKLFLVDGSGALLSAFLLGVILVELQSVFGIPQSTLYFLAIFPCLFAVYDFYCVFSKQLRIGVFLKGIASMNLFYIFVSLGLCLYHVEQITICGWAYIVLEMIIVMTLAYVEYSVGKEL